MISAIDARESLRFMVTEESFYAERFIEFLRRLIVGYQKPVFLIADGHPTHEAKKVKQFVEENSEKLELYYLSGYSPELNPDEHVWNHVKDHTIGQMAIKGPGQLETEVHRTLRRLARMPHIVWKFLLMAQLRHTVY